MTSRVPAAAVEIAPVRAKVARHLVFSGLGNFCGASGMAGWPGPPGGGLDAWTLDGCWWLVILPGTGIAVIYLLYTQYQVGPTRRFLEVKQTTKKKIFSEKFPPQPQPSKMHLEVASQTPPKGAYQKLLLQLGLERRVFLSRKT
jgi:hypothetical protein